MIETVWCGDIDGYGRVVLELDDGFLGVEAERSPEREERVMADAGSETGGKIIAEIIRRLQDEYTMGMSIQHPPVYLTPPLPNE